MSVRPLLISLAAALLVLSLLGANTAAGAVSVTQTITTDYAVYGVVPSGAGTRAIALHGDTAGSRDAVTAVEVSAGTETWRLDGTDLLDAFLGVNAGDRTYVGNTSTVRGEYNIVLLDPATGIVDATDPYIIVPSQAMPELLGTTPDGRTVVSFNSDSADSSNASALIIAAGDTTGTETQATGTSGDSVVGYAFAPDSRNAFFATSDTTTGEVFRLDLTTNAITAMNVGLGGGEEPGGVAVSPDGRYLAVALTSSVGMILHEFATGTNTRITSGLTGVIGQKPAFSVDGKTLYALSNNQKTIFAIDVASASVRNSVDLSSFGGVNCLSGQYCLTPTANGRQLLVPMDVTGTAPDRIAVLDTSSETLSSVTVGNSPKYVWPADDGVTAFVTYGATSPDMTVLRTASAPGAPTGVTATPANAAAAITWTAPTDDGGSDITNYTATANPGGRTCTWTSGALGCTVDGLTNGAAYTFTVTATNAVGASAPSAPSAAVTPGVAPGAPTKVKATPGPKNARISWMAPAERGTGITGYVVTASPGGATCTTTTTTCTISRLLDTKAYTFRVRATSAVGDGAASAATKAVRPYTKMKAAKPRVQGTRILLRITAPAAGRITVTGTTSTLTACTRTGRARGKGAVALTCILRAPAIKALKRATQRVTVLTLLTTKKGRTYGASQIVTIKRTRG